MYNQDNIFNRDESFIWWLGVIEDRKEDPDRLGRVRVRIWGYHSDDKEVLPTDQLPWAITMQPTTSSAVSGTGTSPTFLLEGTWVFGFFLDGNDKQQPVVIGTLGGYTQKVLRCGQEPNYLGIEVDTAIEFPRATPVLYPEASGDLASGAVTWEETIAPGGDGAWPTLNAWLEFQTEAFQDPNGLFPKCTYIDKPDTNKLATGDVLGDEETIFSLKLEAREVNLEIPTALEGETWDEPEPAYCSIYPYNKVFETESGHIVEYDDTAGHERIQIYHRTGTYIEIDANGTVTQRTMGDSFNLVDHNQYVKIEKDSTVTVKGTAKIYVLGDADIQVDKNARMKVGEDMNVEVAGTFNMKAKEVNILAEDSLKLKSGTEGMHLHSDGDFFETSDGLHNTKAASGIRETAPTIHMNGPEAATATKAAPPAIVGTELEPKLEREDCLLEELIWPEDPVPLEDVVAPMFPPEFAIDFVLPPIEEAAEASPFGAVAPAAVATDDIAELEVAPPAVQIGEVFQLGDLINVNVPAVAAAADIPVGDFLVNLRNLTVNTIEPINAEFPDMVVVGTNNVPADEGFAAARTLGQAVSLQFTNTAPAEIPNIATWVTNNVPYSQVQLQYFVSPVTNDVRAAIGVALGSTTVAFPVMTTFNGISLGEGIRPYAGV